MSIFCLLIFVIYSSYNTAIVYCAFGCSVNQLDSETVGSDILLITSLHPFGIKYASLHT